MKKTIYILFISFVIVLFAGCKKSNSSQEVYYMSANFNGMQTNLSSSLWAVNTPNIGFLSTGISGNKSISDGWLLFNLINYDNAPLVPDTYTGTNNNRTLYVTYKIEGKEYRNLAFEGFNVQVTNITTESIKGNFSGVIKIPTNQTDSIKISNGQFYVPIIN